MQLAPACVNWKFCPFTVTVNCRVKKVPFWLTLSVGDPLPFPEPGDTSAQPTSVRAVHAQFDEVLIANWKRPPCPGIVAPGSPETLAEQPVGVGLGVGLGVGDGDGDGEGDGPVTVPGFVSSLLEPEHAGTTTSASRSNATGVRNSRVIARRCCMPAANTDGVAVQ